MQRSKYHPCLLAEKASAQLQWSGIKVGEALRTERRECKPCSRLKRILQTDPRGKSFELRHQRRLDTAPSHSTWFSTAVETSAWTTPAQRTTRFWMNLWKQMPRWLPTRKPSFISVAGLHAMDLGLFNGKAWWIQTRHSPCYSWITGTYTAQVKHMLPRKWICTWVVLNL